MIANFTDVSLKALMLVISVAFLMPEYAFAEDFLDRLMARCAEGNMQACDEIDKLTDRYREQINRLNAQADRFQADAPSLGIEKNNIPNFKRAYPIILHRYMSSDTIEPAHRRRGLNKKIIDICAQQFHDLFFLHGKEIPRTESGQIDWGMIYPITINHYFRFCSKKVQ